MLDDASQTVGSHPAPDAGMSVTKRLDGRTAAWCLAQADRALLRWVELVGERDVDALLALYARDAILVPTLSDEVRGREGERRAYFETFLANAGLSCAVTVQKKRVSHLLGTVVVGGLYTFTMMCDGVPVEVPARFLFTFEEIDGEWLITGHHSSKALEDLSIPAPAVKR